MIVLDPNKSSPWWPLMVADALAYGQEPGVYSLTFQHWIVWHFHFIRHGAGFVAMTAEGAAALLGLPESQAVAA